MTKLEKLERLLTDKEKRVETLADPKSALAALGVKKVARPRLLPGNAADLNVYRP